MLWKKVECTAKAVALQIPFQGLLFYPSNSVLTQRYGKCFQEEELDETFLHGICLESLLTHCRGFCLSSNSIIVVIIDGSFSESVGGQ
jgi:hypothetical protein